MLTWAFSCGLYGIHVNYAYFFCLVLDLLSFPSKTGNPFFNNAGYAIVGPKIEFIDTTIASKPIFTQYKLSTSSFPHNFVKVRKAPFASDIAPIGKVTTGNTSLIYLAIDEEGNKYIGYRPTSVNAQLYSTIMHK